MKDEFALFDKENHFKPKINKAKFYSLEGYDFCWYIIQQIEKQSPKISQKELSKYLSVGQKTIWFWWYIDGQVTNGGFSQLYYNGYHNYVPAAIAGLKALGILEAAEIINDSYKFYKKNYKKIHSDKYKGFFGTDIYKDFSFLDNLSDKYFEIYKRIPIQISAFAKQNPDEFCLDEEGKELLSSYTGYYKNENNYLEYNNYKFYLQDGKLQGEFYSFFPSGKIEYRLNFENGKRNGECVNFYESGNRKLVTFHKKNSSDIEHHHYFENNQLHKIETQNNEGRRIGDYSEYYKNGVLKTKMTYDENSNPFGDRFSYWENGNLQLHSRKTNEKYPIFISAHSEDGKQTLKEGEGYYKITYRDSSNYYEVKNYRWHGSTKSYKKGDLASEGQFINGLEEGYYTTYNTNGTVKRRTLYKKGKVIKNERYK